MFVGDVVQLDATVRHGVATPRIVWRSSNTAIVQVGPTGRLRALAAGRATVTAEVDETTDQMAVEVLELPSLYQPRDVEYFGEVAFGTEAGTGEAVLRKWATAPRIRVHGAPTPADQAALARIVAEVNELVPDLGMVLTATDPNVELHFIPTEEFPLHVPTYVRGNLGYFWAWWNPEQEITRAHVLVASEGIDQSEREHLLREELTQILGLMRDSWSYPESIFYQGWTETGSFAPIDRTVLEMLYRAEVRPGQDRGTVLERLQTLRVDRSELSPPASRRADPPG